MGEKICKMIEIFICLQTQKGMKFLQKVGLTHDDQAKKIVYSRADYQKGYSSGKYKTCKDYLIYQEHYIAIGPGYISYYGRPKLSQESKIAKYRKGRSVEDLQEKEKENFYSGSVNNFLRTYHGDNGNGDRSWQKYKINITK